MPSATLTDPLSWLNAQCTTAFRLNDLGRIIGENDPDGSPGPRMWFAGSEAGNVTALRHDVHADAAAQILRLSQAEPPFLTGVPGHLDAYIRLIAEDTPAKLEFGVSYVLPMDLNDEASPVHGVSSGSTEADDLLARLAEEGLPEGLVELGFQEVSELWAPWCVAMLDGEITSIAFAARLGASGCELGVATVPRFRGLGHAGAIIRAWTRHPELRQRRLFYTTRRTNAASQRVAAKLGLREVGANLRII